MRATIEARRRALTLRFAARKYRKILVRQALHRSEQAPCVSKITARAPTRARYNSPMRRALVVAVLSGCAFRGGTQGVGSADAANGSAADAPDGAMAPSFMPSHVDPGYYHPAASPLSGVIGIDTDSLELDLGSGLAPPPTGTAFADDGNGHAVLSVGAWTVDQDVRVTGTRSLVVVAAGAVAIAHTIDASAHNEVAGPGAATSGRGNDGSSAAGSDDVDNGGGGGGFGGAGAAGGGATTDGAGGSAGGAYGSGESVLQGGSAGGNGGTAAGCAVSDTSRSQGGGGGGALQISSAMSISIIGGAIDVGGGGGRGGCTNSTINSNNTATAGGGGGAGGELFLESPTITTNGVLAANGGGGGGGAIAGGNSGGDGGNGAIAASAAKGGPAADSSEGSGGAGGYASTAPGVGTAGTNGGGGGGGVGRIWLRTRGATTPGGTITPAPAFDPSLP